MNYNQVFDENVPKNIEPRKWWQYTWVKIIGISFIVLIIFAIILSLVLIFVVFAPKKLEITTTSSLPVTTTISTSTTTITTAITQQAGKLYINVR